MMTKQEIFNMAYLGLKAQDFERSLDSFGKCKYRRDNDMKCAIGHCLTEEELSGFEGLLVDLPVTALVKLTGKSKLVVEEDIYCFLRNIQMAHDFHCGEGMRQALINFAQSHDLTIPDEKVSL